MLKNIVMTDIDTIVISSHVKFQVREAQLYSLKIYQDVLSHPIAFLDKQRIGQYIFDNDLNMYLHKNVVQQ